MGWEGSGHPVGVEELREMSCGIFLVKAGKLGEVKGIAQVLFFFFGLFFIY